MSSGRIHFMAGVLHYTVFSPYYSLSYFICKLSSFDLYDMIHL